MTETPETAPRQRAAWEDVAVLIVGGWLTFSPPSLEINGAVTDTATIVIAGLVLIVLGGGSMRSNALWLKWAVIVTGAALAIAPWVVGFELKTAVINATACGIAVVALSAWRVFELHAKKAAAPAPTTAVRATEEQPRKAA
jgi:hypothetical protein